MSEEQQLLETIEEALVEHGGDLGGWTQLENETLKIFDGRVTLRAKVDGPDPEVAKQIVHAHVFATIHEHDDEELDACLVGISDDRGQGLNQIAGNWLVGVAGPIRSFLDNQPVCMTCQAGVENGDQSQGYSPGDYGLPGLRAYVGPGLGRNLLGDAEPPALDDSTPWFRYAAQAAAPRRLHLAKATLQYSAQNGWSRQLEIDGHDVTHHDDAFSIDQTWDDMGMMVRYAVFEFPRNSTEIERRAELERTIHHFAKNMSKSPSVDLLMQEMVQKDGFDIDLVKEVETISTIAFSRAFFAGFGVQYSPFITRVHQDGTVEKEVPLMSLPAYSRGLALAAKLSETMKQKDFQSLCLYNAESNAILQYMEFLRQHGQDASDLSSCTMAPSLVPMRGVSREVMDEVVKQLVAEEEKENPKVDPLADLGIEPGPRRGKAKSKPWWKFW